MELQVSVERPTISTEACKRHRLSDGDKPVWQNQEEVDRMDPGQGGLTEHSSEGGRVPTSRGEHSGERKGQIQKL